MVNSRSNVEAVSDLATLVLGKPPGDSLPVFCAHSFARNRQFALLESVQEGNNIPQKNVPDESVDLRTACIRSGHATDRATAPVTSTRVALASTGKCLRPSENRIRLVRNIVI